MRVRTFVPWRGLVTAAVIVALLGHGADATGRSSPAHPDVAALAAVAVPAGGAGPTPGEAPSGLFAGPTTFAAGVNPHAVAIGDLNGDAKNDLVVTNAHGNSVSVLLGNGSGGFSGPTHFVTGGRPKHVVLADFNGDGLLDLASANQDDSTSSILLGDGDGTFGPRTDVATCPNAHEVATGDFNEDGKKDLAAACWGGSVISILRGNGNGTFAPKSDFSSGSAPHSLAVGRFNADAHDDLAVANHGNRTVGVLLGTGTGSFASVVTYTVGTGPHSVRTGDLNKDGKADLAVANDGSDSVSVLLGTGTGTFGGQVAYAVGKVPKSVAVADLDGDGNLDLITANTAGNGDGVTGIPGGDVISVLLGAGNGTFGAASTDLVGPTPFSVVTGFLNADARPDVVTANWDGNNATVLLNTSGGGPPPDTTRPTIVGISPSDGASDVAFGSNVSSTFSEAMSAGSVSATTVTLVEQGSTTPIAATVTYDGASRTVTLNPGVDLEGSTAYVARVKGGPSGVKDLAGNPLLADRTWTFTTADVPDPTDTTAPSVTAPAARIASGSTVGATTLSLRLTWTGTDSESGLASFQVGRSVSGGPMTPIATLGPAVTSLATQVTPRLKYSFAVRATDAAGNTSDWATGPVLGPVTYQETSPLAAYTGVWSSSRATTFLGGASRTSSRIGARMTFTFTGRAVAWVTPKSRRMGSAKVYVDGVYRGTVSLYSATSRNRQAVFEYSWPAAGQHTLRIVLAGPSGRPKVNVDALVVVR